MGVVKSYIRRRSMSLPQLCDTIANILSRGENGDDGDSSQWIIVFFMPSFCKILKGLSQNAAVIIIVV